MKLFRYLRRRFPTASELVSIIFNQGLRGYIDYYRNSRQAWKASELLIGRSRSNASSISDETPYIGLCKLAVEDELVFSKFKSSFEYRGILEHCYFTQGRDYLRMINSSSEILTNLKEIVSVDNGMPYTYFYKGLGAVSPTQIRYAKVLQDIELLFGGLDKISIAEIGVGYGGQAIHILNRWAPKNYYVYDLEWPAKLMTKNLKQSSLELSIQPEIRDWNEKITVDLVISNYAFSELYRDVQEKYLRNVIEDSKAGYIIYNHIHENGEESMNAQEFASRIPGAVILKENPLSFPGNVLIVWGHNPNADLSLFK